VLAFLLNAVIISKKTVVLKVKIIPFHISIKNLPSRGTCSVCYRYLPSVDHHRHSNEISPTTVRRTGFLLRTFSTPFLLKIHWL
jgi:hypothetical protein